MDTIKIKLPKLLWEHMDGMGFRYGEDDPEHAVLFKKITVGEPLDRREAAIVLDDGIESALAGLEAIAGSAGDFEEGRDIAIAMRSAASLERKLKAFLA